MSDRLGVYDYLLDVLPREIVDDLDRIQRRRWDDDPHRHVVRHLAGLVTRAEDTARRMVAAQRADYDRHQEQVREAARRGREDGDEAIATVARVWRLVWDAGRRKTVSVAALRDALEPPRREDPSVSGTREDGDHR